MQAAFFAGAVDGGAATGLRMVVTLADGCDSAQTTWTAVFNSVTGDYDPDFDSSAAGTEIDAYEVATSEAATAYTDASVQSIADRVAASEVAAAAATAEVQDALTAAQAEIRSLLTLTASITACAASSQVLGANGECRHAVPTCSLPSGVPATGVGALSFTGDAVPGTLAKHVCAAGSYDRSAGRTCQIDRTWTAGRADCQRCRASCAACTEANACTACTAGGPTPRLVHGECRGNDGLSRASPLRSCMEGKLQGFGNGVYWMIGPATATGQRTGYRQRTYQIYCMNEPGLGWTDVAGGGWEILSVQTGGHGNTTQGPRHTSNRIMRGAPNDGFGTNIGRNPTAMPVLGTNSYVGHSSQMSPAWGERARQAGNDWIKFSAKIQGGTVRGQDHFKLDFGNSSTFPFWWMYANANRGSCVGMPGTLKMRINNVPVGMTDVMHTRGSNSIGLANPTDACGTRTAMRITSRGAAHGFSRIDHDNSENTIRHLISYTDSDRGVSASRCHYCCWGCGGWREVVVWASRPHQPETV